MARQTKSELLGVKEFVEQRKNKSWWLSPTTETTLERGCEVPQSQAELSPKHSPKHCYLGRVHRLCLLGQVGEGWMQGE